MTKDEDLAARIEAARARHAARTGRDAPDAPVKSSSGGAIGMALTIGVQLIVAIGLGTWLGYAMDGWFGTRPLFMIVMMLLFAGAGFLNVFRGADRAHRQMRGDANDDP